MADHKRLAAYEKSVVCGVCRSVEYGVCMCGVWSVECGVWNVVRGMDCDVL